MKDVCIKVSLKNATAEKKDLTVEYCRLDKREYSVEMQLQEMIPNSWRVSTWMEVVCKKKVSNESGDHIKQRPHSRVTWLKRVSSREVTARDNFEELQMWRGLAMKVV